MLDVSIDGLGELERYLGDVSKKTSDLTKPLRAIGLALIGLYQKNMVTGKAADGSALAPVSRWTRIAGKGAGITPSRLSGSMTPLHNTGALKNSMRIVASDNESVEIGWVGKFQNIASAMTFGTPGRMTLRERPIVGLYSGVKTGRSGREYMRVKTDDSWITKRVSGGSIPIHPKARPFFYVTAKQSKEAIRQVSRWLDGILK